MKKIIGMLVIVMAVLLLAGCGSGGKAPVFMNQPTPTEAILDLSGTTWEGETTNGYNFTNSTFLADGTFKYSYTSDVNNVTDMTNATWTQEGKQVKIEFNNHFADYTGTLEGDLLSGTASNVKGNSWTWEFRRVK